MLHIKWLLVLFLFIPQAQQVMRSTMPVCPT
jgi:hypothetical protein